MAVCTTAQILVLTLTLLYIVSVVNTQVLTPPYFNLAVGKQIEATATCGEGIDDEEELFCKLTGADLAGEIPGNYEVIQGQLCDFCKPQDPDQGHPPQQALDGTERWWQSPPLSRGIEFNEVNLTMNLGQEFHVAYVFIKMANSPRPGVFALERSTDYGKTWKPWQYFADTRSDCHNFFGAGNYEEKIREDDSVVCTTKYSTVVPLEGGEIVVSLVNGRPSAQNFSYASTLQEWTRATNVRLRLLRTKTLLGHLMAIARQDPTVTRRYFYSIKDISIGGRCVCNGHAEICDKTDPFDPFKLLCRCQHNTCGDQCDKCCPGFVQKNWRPATIHSINECEPCNCHDHSTECVYDEEVALNRQSLDISGRYEGGGVCQNCQHNTEGINCEKCRDGYFRPDGVSHNDINACVRCQCDLTYTTGACEEETGRCICRPEYAGPDCDRCNTGFFGYPACQPCECNFNGTEGQVCEARGGQCPCKPSYTGPHCDRCAYGYYGFPQCQSCACDQLGSNSAYCDPQNGHCSCQPNYGGRDCGTCGDGFYAYPACQLCDCDPTGSTLEMCDKYNGQCLCKPGFGGPRCDRCDAGFYRYPRCMECGCNARGSQVDDCDENGQCICKPNFSGLLCDRCAPGYFKYPECTPCNCDIYGAYGIGCDELGQCTCRQTFEGLTCNKCRPSYYNYPMCEECNCNPAGAQEVPGYPLGGCGSGVTGQLCQCKERVQGHICEQCKMGYWNLNINNPMGCEDCGCYRPGTVGGSRECETSTGQCVCKPFTNTRRCDMCRDGTYNLQEYNVFGCDDCGCVVGGSLDHVCEKDGGQCNCRPRVVGRTCDRPLTNHFYPTLHQHRYELEDGRTASGGAVRYAFDDDVFQDYSWRGYAIFSKIQDEVLVDVEIEKPTLYRLIFRYVSRNLGAITAEVTVTPERPTDVPQTSTVMFQPAFGPKFVTVSGSTFVLNPGRWTISLKTHESIFVDYLVLLPQSYYEASILQKRINNPCTVPLNDELCKHFVYVDVSSYPMVGGDTGYVRVDNQQERTQLFPDTNICDELGTSDMAYLNRLQTELHLNLPIPQPGEYVFIVQYHSTVMGRNQDLDVDIMYQARDERGDSVPTSDRGNLVLQGCPYSSMCRQLITNDDGEYLVFNIDGTYASITLTGRSDIDLAIDSVIAIPLNQWNIEFIKPTLKCIMMDKHCVELSFLTPTGSQHVEVESPPNEDRVATDVPPHILDLNVKVIKLDSISPTVSVKAMVLNPGAYVYVVHYYQPYHTGFDVQVNLTQDGVVNKGKLHAAYCPGVSGCRAVIQFEDVLYEQAVQVSSFDYVLTFTSNSGKPLWLDDVTAVQAVHFQPHVLEVLPMDWASVFITKCTSNHYYIDSAASTFCRDSVFSLTTEYNNGAKSCDCNSDGSLRFNCDEFGGQCQCRPNVIGRTCSVCRTGYYGFPNCQPCSCPSGLCDPDSGQCVCPPRVTGDNCNVCLPRTFGFDPLIGCEECTCDATGVQNNDLDCDINTGQCSCKPNVGGRRCNHCLAGHYSFPSCLPCSCDSRGTTYDICDQSTADCLCKDNVEGPQCAQCKQSTFYLEERNPTGCTKCFCFGTTQLCRSSTFRRSQVRDMEGWGITNLNNPVVDKYDRDLEVRVQTEDIIDQSLPQYWVAPFSFLGNKVTSYGGKLIYTITFRYPFDQDSTGIVKPDVRLEGNDLTLVHTSPEQPVPGVPLNVEVDMIQTKFIHESSGAPASREQFMTLLANIQSMQIRASYYSIIESATLSDVHLDIATEDATGSLARNVEQCECPPNYKGTSCEECADGYYRSREGPYLGVCIPCQCHGRADTCDPQTGECTNCRDNFGGAQCLTCKQGYYQDAFTQRCEICSCPLAVESNNFASTCEVYNGQVFRCLCLEGYTGTRCDTCDYGYYGDPMETGGSCSACGCSGNIDVSDRRSCDPYTGECLVCINNSMGPQCETCIDWYHGDAVNLKNCAPCTCNRQGSELCDSVNGACLCKPNVVGLDCNECAPGTFGFESGLGCEVCDCDAEGSSSDQCDVLTGQCLCQEGVTGRRCNQCEDGYWNLGPFGCEKCQCEFEGAVTCDPFTGACQCRPGVTGPRCDRCLPRWALIPDVGCQQCDSCIHLLLDDVEIMDHNITTISSELDSVSVGVLAYRRLERINQTAQQLRPQVDNLIVSGPSESDLLAPIKRELTQLEDTANRLSEKSQMLAREAEVTKGDALDTRDESDELADLVQMAVKAARDAVHFAEDVLADILSNIHNQNVENLIAEAERILEDLRNKDFTAADERAQEELNQAEDVLRRAKQLSEKAIEQMDRVKELKEKLGDIGDKLRDLMNNSRHSLDNSQAALDLNARNRATVNSVKDEIVEIQDIRDDMIMMTDMAKDLLEKAKQFLEDAKRGFWDVERESSKLDGAMSSLGDFVDDLTQQNNDLDPLVRQATDHAYDLMQQAVKLADLLADTTNTASGALNASRAYEAIVTAINDAENASRDAVQAAMKALDQSNGLADRARQSKLRSQQLKDLAEDTKERVVDELQPRLINAQHSTDVVEDLNNKIDDELTELLLGVAMLPEDGFGDKARQAAMKAMDAQARATTAQDKIQGIINKLPDDKQKVDEISRHIFESNRKIERAQTQVNEVLNLVPDATELLDRLSTQADKVNRIGTDLGEHIRQLKEKIATTRGEASRIMVGVEFFRNTTLQLRNPQNMAHAGSYTKLQLYFKTKENNALIAYLGADNPNSAQHADYLAIEIIRRKVVLTFDLGDGSATVTNDKEVSDNKWHEIIVERTGKVATLTVRTQDEPDSVSSVESGGTYSVLELNPSTAKFYVGGVPRSAGLDSRLNTLYFVGCIEDVMLDNVAVGLWNFVEGENNNKGCLGRDVLLAPVSDGFRFEGKGSISISKGFFNPQRTSQIQIKFKSYAEEGLIMLISGASDFMTLELKEGKLLFQYDLGSGVAKLESTERYNDGRWHTIFASRRYQNGLLKVDNATAASGKSPGSNRDLNIYDTIHVGGYYSGVHNFTSHVTSQGFDGCVKDLNLGGNNMDLNDYIQAKGIKPGCPEVEVARVVSFDSSATSSYLALDPVLVDNKFQTTLKIKTEQQDGLIYYIADDTQQNSFALSMVNGKLVVTSNRDGLVNRLETAVDNYNDGRWHFITVTKINRDLQLDVDDTEMVKVQMDNRRRITSPTPFYFGGVPDSYTIIKTNVGTDVSFLGCVGDVTVNGGFVNFASASQDQQMGTTLSRCPIPDPEVSTVLPSLPPLPPITEGPLTPDSGTPAPPEAQCALPREPDETLVSDTEEDGTSTQFGKTTNSRLEFDTEPDSLRTEFNFTLEMKTTEEDGVLFYVADERQVDFIGLYMKGGQLVFTYNCGTGPGKAVSPFTYNDGKWHKVAFYRKNWRGTLYVDGEEVGNARAEGSARVINIAPPYYLGGLSSDAAERASGNLEGLTQGFTGCLRNLRLKNKDFGPADRRFDTESCSVNQERGSFFYADGGYVEIDDNFKVGLDMDISLEVKPRSLSGVILSVVSPRGDYLVLQMVNGEIKFGVDNGEGPIVTTHSPPARNELCNGRWHSIQATKAKNVVRLRVNGVYTVPGIGQPGVSSTDTADPLYVGGLPETHKGVFTTDQFVGCIRDLKIQNVAQDMTSGQIYGKVKLDTCPTS